MKRQTTLSAYFSTKKKPKPAESILDTISSTAVETKQKRHEAFVAHLTTSPVEPKETPLTPLENQVVRLKQTYPSCVLMIEVGYKYKFFGEDAKVRGPIYFEGYLNNLLL
ncbi:hypothetical protein BDB01DRAFT_409087 [Pilobolus umbonatus]|nr:hypothetical protein BDB01DRAFT_409087 [Pilobolus umbonatus]